VRLPPRPTVYEINTAVWLRRLGGIALDAVPAGEWDALAALPVDAVWLMGVWERSPAGLRIAREDPALDAGNRAALPDLHDEDVIGSPYCVRDYVVDARFGGPEALAGARDQLAARGLALILDYVPNHVAPDHPWVTARPDYFVHLEDGTIANGRDPYFPPWPDVLQLDAFSPGLREAVVGTLIAIGDQCDGMRCDMAMLMTNEVFARTWGDRAGPPPPDDYWPTVIAAVKAVHPELTFIAEAYWDMEWTLQQQGFDLCYDKRLYDRLVHDGAEAVRGHLQAEASYQEGLIRFIENHDEPRAAATFGPAQDRAAAVVMSTVRGARLYHDGQLDGHHTHIPVFLSRGPDEPPDRELQAFYERLLRIVADDGLRDGDWRLCECTGWPDDPTYRELVSWCWRADGQLPHVVVVNLSDAPVQARVHVPWADELRGRSWTLVDRLAGDEFERSGDELAADGLYVGLGPWGSHVLAFG
jgi:hypothetical protein